ncbi:MAG: acyl-CoA carboxylase subunit beta [Burkholderiaceae bacterium]
MAEERAQGAAADWQALDTDFETRRQAAEAMGGPEKLAKRRGTGALNVRERMERLADPGTFLEFGLFAQSAREPDRARTPTDGKISGLAKIDGRDVAVVANDFTIMGASSATINGRKIAHVKDLATRRGLPMVFLGESTGARMPDVMGARAFGAGDRPTQYRRTREAPWASGVLGHCYGSSAWYSVLSDFVAMRRGAMMAISSNKLTSRVISESTDPEDLGGWRMHAEVTGFVDTVVDSDEEAIDQIRRFLSYMPSHCMEAPPRAAAPAQAPDGMKIRQLMKLERTKVYDMRKVIECIVDPGSLFEMKSRFAKNTVTALARIGGRVAGFIANNPLHKGGAVDVESCAKVISFMVLCDSFNIPLVFIIDQPGFLVGIEGEKRGAIGAVMNWMNALSLVSVPKISIIARKTYGQAHLNMGGGGNSDVLLSWTSAEISFMDPHSAVSIVHGIKPEQDPARYAELLAEMSSSTSPYEMASAYNSHVVIPPEQTRPILEHLLDALSLRMTDGVGEHLMRTWPTSF